MKYEIKQEFIGVIGDTEFNSQDMYQAVGDFIDNLEDEYDVELSNDIVPLIKELVVEAASWRSNKYETTYVGVANKLLPSFCYFDSIKNIRLDEQYVTKEFVDKFNEYFSNIQDDINIKGCVMCGY